MSATLAIAWLFVGAVSVQSEGACPSAARVEERIAQLLGEDTPDHVARIELDNALLRLELREPGGRLLARKALERSGSCEGLAQVAAVVIASWEAQLRDGTLALPDEAREFELAAAAAVPSSRFLELPRPPAPRAPAPASPPLQPRLDLGGSMGFSERWSGGGLLRGSLGRDRWAAVLLVQLEAARQLSLGEGRLRWNRPLVGAGARYVAIDGRPRLELEAGAAVSLLLLRGGGFDENASAMDVDPAAYGAATVSWDLGTLRPFLGLLGVGFIREQTAQVAREGPSGSAPSRTLPRGAVTFLVGVAWPGNAP